jgi:sec-independent protein translocase protein TatA
MELQMPVLANIFGADTLVIVGLIALLFGGSQLPKLARSLGSAKSEFERGQRDSSDSDPDEKGKSSKDDTPPTSS